MRGEIFGVGLSKKKKKKSFSKKNKGNVVVIESLKEACKKKGKKGRVEATWEMVKMFAAESISTDPLQNVPAPDAASDAET